MELNAKKLIKVAGLLEPIKTRWSPRTFLPQKIEKEKLDLLLEAARWAPSCFNEQPWRFIIGEKDGIGDYNGILTGLVEFNQLWAKLAPLLILIASSKNSSLTGKPNIWSGYDTGQAVGHLSLQAQFMGLYTHQMGGIVPETLRKNFEIPEEFDINSVMAVGYVGKLADVPGPFKEKENAERQRKLLSDIVFTSKWGNSYK